MLTPRDWVVSPDMSSMYGRLRRNGAEGAAGSGGAAATGGAAASAGSAAVARDGSAAVVWLMPTTVDPQLSLRNSYCAMFPAGSC
ncbi:hypothetical protein GCM10009809_07940 [Isoptericola hypogeus]|uniref:Uncharacterized protein n=1 Tax=Isoptericola hypogeus TaxID=300179 RepID=A0ABN2IY43_9MICO